MNITPIRLSPIQSDIKRNKVSLQASHCVISVPIASAAIPPFSYNNIFINKKIAFKGNPLMLFIPDGNLSAKEAINLYKNLSNGDYINVFEDIHCPENKLTRLHNYSFLDKIANSVEKKEFIEYYKNLTGFPNLAKVSSKIESEFVDSIVKSEYILNTNNKTNAFDVIWAGYNPNCSVGKNKALPGSDLDAAYIVIRGDASYDESRYVHQFNAELWSGTDQRILSYNHSDAFPQVFTLREVYDFSNQIENVPKNYDYYKMFAKKDDYNFDYVDANQYLAHICDNFPRFAPHKFTKENIKNYAFFAECFKEGKMLYEKTSFNPDVKAHLQKSDFFSLVNASQVKALKNFKCDKSKIQARNDIEETFNQKTIDEQFKIVKNIIMAASDDNVGCNKYYSYDEDRFTPMINRLLGR